MYKLLITPGSALVLVPNPPLQGMVSLVASPLSFFRLGEGSEGSWSGGLHQWPWVFCFWYAPLARVLSLSPSALSWPK